MTHSGTETFVPVTLGHTDHGNVGCKIQNFNKSNMFFFFLKKATYSKAIKQIIKAPCYDNVVIQSDEERYDTR